MTNSACHDRALADLHGGVPALPRWNDLTDLDKGAALLHLHKREWEGGDYAEEHYPAVFYDHPTLTAMDSGAACDYATSLDEHADALDTNEYARLYDLALDAEHNR